MADVTLGLGVNTSQAAKDLKQFGSNAKSAADGISKSFAGIAVAVGGALAGLASLAVLKDITQAASAQQDAINKLNTSLKNAGTFSDEASQSFQTFASDLQKVSTVGDETTLELAALARNFTQTNEQAQQLTLAAVNLSAGIGIDLESAVKNLGKTFGGLTGELGESVPELRNLSKEALQSGAAIDFVLSKFGISAQSELLTFSGITKGLKNSFGDLKEELGFAIVENEALIIALNNLNKIIIALGGNVKENRSILNDFVTGAVNVAVFAVAELAKFTQVLIDTFFAVVQAIKIANIAFFEFFKAIAGAPADIANAFGDLFEFLINGFASALTGLFEIFEKIPGFTKVFGEVSKEAAAAGSRLSKQFKSFGTVFDGAQKASDEYFDSLILGQEKVIFENELARQSYQDITDTVVGFAEKTASEIQNASGTIRKESKEAGKAIKANIEQPLSDAQKKAAETEQKFKEFFQGLERESGTLEEQILKIGEALTTAANEGDFDKFKTFYDKLKGLQKEYADQIQKDEDARVKALAESLAASQKEFDKAAQAGIAIASSVLGADSTSLIDIDKLQGDIATLSQSLNKSFADATLEGLQSALTQTTEAFRSEIERISFQIKDIDVQLKDDTTFVDKLKTIEDAVKNDPAVAQLEEINKTLQRDGGLSPEQRELLQAQKFSLQDQIDASKDSFEAQKEELKLAEDGRKKALEDRKKELQEQLDQRKREFDARETALKREIDVRNEIVKKEEEIEAKKEAVNKSTLQVLSSIAGVVGDILLPGFGGIISSLTNFLGGGPEQIKALVTGLVDALPLIIDTIAESIPAVIEILIERLPDIIDALSSASPKIIAALVKAAPDIIRTLVKMAPDIALALIRSILRSPIEFLVDFSQVEAKLKEALQAIVDAFFKIPEAVGFAVEQFATAIVDGGKNFIGAILDGAGQFVGKIIDEVKGFLGIGGGAVDRDKRGLSVDNISTGGLVTSFKSLTGLGLTGPAPVQTARQFSSSQDKTDNTQLIQDFSKAISESLGNKVATLLTSGTTRPLVVNLEVGQAQLASVLLQLNRNGFRTA
jgi:hypothetical protein